MRSGIQVPLLSEAYMESMFGWVNTLNEISGKKSFTDLACRDLVDLAVSIVCIVNADIKIWKKV